MPRWPCGLALLLLTLTVFVGLGPQVEWEGPELRTYISAAGVDLGHLLDLNGTSWTTALSGAVDSPAPSPILDHLPPGPGPPPLPPGPGPPPANASNASAARRPSPAPPPRAALGPNATQRSSTAGGSLVARNATTPALPLPDGGRRPNATAPGSRRLPPNATAALSLRRPASSAAATTPPAPAPTGPPPSTSPPAALAPHAAAARWTARFCAPFVTSVLAGRPNAGTFNCAERLAPLHRCQKVGAGKQGYAVLCRANLTAGAPRRVAVKCSTRTDKPAQAVHEVVVACRLMLLPTYNVTDSFVWILDFAWCNESQTKDFLERVQVHDGRLVRRSLYRTFISYQLAERTPKGKIGAGYIFEMVYAILTAFQAFQVGVRDLQQKHLYCLPVDYARVYEVDGAACVVRSPVMVKLIDLGAYGISAAGSPGDLLGLSNYYHLFRTPSLLTASAWDLYMWTKEARNMGHNDIAACLKRLVLRMAEYDNGEFRHNPAAPLPKVTTLASAPASALGPGRRGTSGRFPRPSAPPPCRPTPTPRVNCTP